MPQNIKMNHETLMILTIFSVSLIALCALMWSAETGTPAKSFLRVKITSSRGLEGKKLSFRPKTLPSMKWIFASTIENNLLGSTMHLAPSDSQEIKAEFILDGSASEGSTSLFYIRPEMERSLAFSFRNGRKLVLSNPSIFEGNYKYYFKWVVEVNDQTQEVRFKTTESFPKCATLDTLYPGNEQVVLKYCDYRSEYQLFLVDFIGN